MGDYSTPQNGDWSLCFACGTVAIFDASRVDGLRVPTIEEGEELRRDPDMQAALAGWRKVRRRQ